MKKVILLVLFILIFIGSGMASQSPDPKNDLSWMMGKNVSFLYANPFGGYRDFQVWQGEIIGTYYNFVQIRYLNGERHWINQNYIWEIKNLDQFSDLSTCRKD